MVYPKYGLRPHRNCQSFYYCPEIWRDTTCSKPAALPLHTLIVSLTQSLRLFTMIQYNTIPYTSVLQCFSYIGKILWLTQYHGSAKLLANKHPKKISKHARYTQTPFLGVRVLSNSFVNPWYLVNRSNFPWYFPYKRKHCNTTVYGIIAL